MAGVNSAPCRHCGVVECEKVGVDGTDRVRARSHASSTRDDAGGVARYRVLAHAVSGVYWRQASCALSSCVTRSCGGRTLLVQLLLMTQQQVAPRKTPRALWTLEGLLLGVRSLVALEVLQPCERAGAGGTHVRPWLVGLGWREGGGGRLCRFGLRCLYRSCG